MAVFEITQAQYQMVMGDNPSAYTGVHRPVEQLSWDTVRGGSWPGGTPAAGTFIDRLRAKVGRSLLFDLPTEAQWEYACRAGTTTSLNSGKDLTSESCSNMAEVGRYHYNRSDGKGGYSEHTVVGSYIQNAWGLYDMHGNVYEWCLDWHAYDVEEVNPVGPSTGSFRILRGGYWDSFAEDCSSADRLSIAPTDAFDGLGFRPVFMAPNPKDDTMHK